ncbi:MAG: FAD:protein FMN transferase [Planctomycetaceae bacterium]|jgi:thiamine biosynthesis lipoprotein|nr:FAD:protein FMN transferase [Planctomycetaceae bacterium]
MYIIFILYFMTWRTPEESALLTVSRKAMNDEFEVMFPRLDFPQGTKAALDALDEVERLEQVLSVFRFDSRVQYINLTAHEIPVRLDEELFGLMSLCVKFAETTEGAVDITSTPLWKIWGFAKRKGKIPNPSEIETALANVNYRLLELNPETKTIRFRKKGVELNFGCVGKGFALDIASRKLLEQHVDRFLFQGGLSSVLAVGSGWKIGVAHPMRPGKRLAELVLNNEAVATSGSQKQFFRHKGRCYSHLIDPRTGQPVEGVLSVTVLAPTGTQAELLSTAFFILGAEQTEEYCKKNQEITALMTISVPKKAGFEIRSFGCNNEKIRFIEDNNIPNLS